MNALRLRRVLRVSFRESEATNWDNFAKAEPDLVRTFGAHDAVAFLSLSGAQLVFVYGFRSFVGKDGGKTAALVSQRIRLREGAWNPLMLQNYAESAGIHLVGLKRFEEVYRESQERKHEQQDAAPKRRAS